MRDWTISAAWVKGVREILVNAGLDARALFAEAGLNPDDLSNPDTRFEPDKLSLLWELATERSGNPALGLAVPSSSARTGLDAIGYVMMSCPDLLTGLERLIRYVRLISSAAELKLIEEKDGYAITVEILPGSRPIPRQRSEFVMATLLDACRWITGRRVLPLAVDLTHPAPADMEPYRACFQCPIRFNAPVHRMLLSRKDLSAPLATSNPMLAELHDRYVAEHLHRIGNDRISYKTRELIIRRLPDGDPARADIARALCMSERTLQRRLQDESTSYHQILDDTRKELAQHYLAQASVTIAQIAYLLGFSDQSTFFRSCKRWFQVSPGEYRGNLKKP